MTTSTEQKPPDAKTIIIMVLLALQFGLQPILTKSYIPQTVCKSSVVLCQEAVKFALAFFLLQIRGGIKESLEGTCNEKGL